MYVAPTLDELRKGESIVYETLYMEYKEAFIAFAKAYTQDDEIIIEAYQEAMITLYENVLRKKVTAFSSSVKTYVFAIGKYKLLEQLRKGRRLVPLAEVQVPEEIEVEESQLSERQQQLKNSFVKLGERCQHILELFYLNGYTIREIKKVAGYENENTVKAQKSRCLRQLKELIHA